MDEQKADILFCDLSYTFAGFMLPAVAHFWGLESNFLTAFQRAEQMVASGKSAVVILVSMMGLHPILEATELDRDTIDQIGKTLWDMNKPLGLDAQKLAKIVEAAFKDSTIADE